MVKTAIKDEEPDPDEVFKNLVRDTWAHYFEKYIIVGWYGRKENGNGNSKS